MQHSNLARKLPVSVFNSVAYRRNVQDQFPQTSEEKLRSLLKKLSERLSVSDPESAQDLEWVQYHADNIVQWGKLVARLAPDSPVPQVVKSKFKGTKNRVTGILVRKWFSKHSEPLSLDEAKPFLMGMREPLDPFSPEGESRLDMAFNRQNSTLGWSPDRKAIVLRKPRVVRMRRKG